MSIYRSPRGEELVRSWCEDRVQAGPWEERRMLETSLGATHLAAMGQGSASVLWLPGTNFNAATSGGLAAVIGTRFRFHVADLPGQPGLSSSVKLGRDRLLEYGRWLNGLVEEVADGPLIVAGHSLGAAVALSARPSAAIQSLALFSPAGLASVRLTPRLVIVSLRWAARPSIRSATGLLQYMQHPSSPVDPDLAEWLALVGKHARQSGAPGPLPNEQVARWRARTTVMTGVADPFFAPDRLQSRAADHLDTVVEAVDDAGHLLPDEDPDRVLAVLLALAESDH